MTQHGLCFPVSERVSNLSGAAGNNTLVGSTVPIGEVWVITQAAAMDVNTNPTRVAIYTNDSTGNIIALLREGAGVGANFWVTWGGNLVLQAGDNMRVLFSGCALNDDLYFVYSGYRMLAP